MESNDPLNAKNQAKNIALQQKMYITHLERQLLQ